MNILKYMLFSIYAIIILIQFIIFITFLTFDKHEKDVDTYKVALIDLLAFLITIPTLIVMCEVFNNAN